MNTHTRSLLALLLLLALDLAGLGTALVHTLDGSVRTRPSTGGASQPPATSAGAAWMPSGPRVLIHSLTADPARPGVVYAAGDVGFLRSDDAGAHWHLDDAGLPVADRALWQVAIYDGERRLAAAGDDGRVYASADGGAHWRSTGPALGSGSVYALATDPARPMTLLAGTTGGIWRSTDGGGNWQLVRATADASVSALLYDRREPRIVYAGVSPGPEQILRSRDGGLHWEPFAAGLRGTEAVMSLAEASDSAPTLYVGLMGRTVWRWSGDQGGWHLSAVGLPPAEHGAALLAGTGRTPTLWVGTMSSGIYRSDDGGAHWSPTGMGLRGGASTVLALAQSGGWLLAGTGDGIYRTPLR